MTRKPIPLSDHDLISYGFQIPEQLERFQVNIRLPLWGVDKFCYNVQPGSQGVILNVSMPDKRDGALIGCLVYLINNKQFAKNNPYGELLKWSVMSNPKIISFPEPRQTLHSRFAHLIPCLALE
jgi:hypothetical protein